MNKQIVIVTVDFEEGDKVEYTINNKKYIGIICGFKYIKHPYRTKMIWGIMSESDYANRKSREYKIDWVEPKNIKLC